MAMKEEQVMGTMTMEVALPGVSALVGTWVDSKPLRIGNKSWKMSYKWEMNIREGYYKLFVKVDNLSNSFIEATTTLTLFSPKGTHLLINGDKVYEANSCVEIGVIRACTINYNY